LRSSAEKALLVDLLLDVVVFGRCRGVSCGFHLSALVLHRISGLGDLNSLVGRASLGIFNIFQIFLTLVHGVVV
jgi:hypothetical protein